MKKKTSKKTVAAKLSRETKKSPKKVSAKPDTIEVPAEIKAINKKLRKLKADEMFLLAVPNAQQDFVAGLISGSGQKTKTRIPKWAKAASSKAIDALGLGFLKNIDRDYIKGLGTIVEFSKTFPAEQLKNPQFPISEFIEFVKQLANHATPLEAQQFADGRVEASKIDAKMSALQQRGKIYLMIAVGWPKVSKLKSTAELLQWLLSFNEKNNVFIYTKAGSDYTREIRAICKSIGLKFNNPGGRPRKVKA